MDEGRGVHDIYECQYTVKKSAHEMAHSASIPPHSRVIVLSYVGCGGRFQGGHTREEEEDSLCVALRARLLCPSVYLDFFLQKQKP